MEAVQKKKRVIAVTHPLIPGEETNEEQMIKEIEAGLRLRFPEIEFITVLTPEKNSQSGDLYDGIALHEAVGTFRQRIHLEADELWIFGNRITLEMQEDIKAADEARIEVRAVPPEARLALSLAHFERHKKY